MDNAPENLARSRSNIIKQEKSKASIRGKAKRAAWDESYLEAVLVS